MVKSTGTSAAPDGASSSTTAVEVPGTRRRTRGIAGSLALGLLLSVMSLFTPIPWAIKIALVATAVLGIAGYSVVHVVHLYDPVDLEEAAEAVGNGSHRSAPDDKDMSAPDDKDTTP